MCAPRPDEDRLVSDSQRTQQTAEERCIAAFAVCGPMCSAPLLSSDLVAGDRFQNRKELYFKLFGDHGF